jgi:cytidylate kinase
LSASRTSFGVIVTISNLYGSGGVAAAAEAARLLGYALVDQQLPVVVAKRMKISRETARASDERGRSLGSRLLSSLEVATPEIAGAGVRETFDSTFAREVERAVVEYAARGNVIIVGRGGGAILGRRSDVLRVFLHAPRAWRIERVMTEYDVDEKAAATEVDRIDRERRAHLRDWYRVEMGSADIVDLAIDTASFGITGSAALIVAAVHGR